jgi:hypothetical protein
MLELILMNLRDRLQINRRRTFPSPPPREERARERRAVFIGFPLSLALSPLLRRGAREFTALCRVSHSLLSKKIVLEL